MRLLTLVNFEIFFYFFLSIFLFFLPQKSWTKSININSLMTGMNTSYLGVEDAGLYDQAFSKKRTKNRVYFYMTYHWDDNPWVLMNENTSGISKTIVTDLNTLDVGIGWLYSDILQMSIEGFGSLVGVSSQFGGRKSTHLGDTRLQLKYRFGETGHWNFALIPELTLPSGSGYRGSAYGASLSNSSTAPGLKVASEFRKNRHQVSINLGYTYYNKAEFKSQNYVYPSVDGRSRTLFATAWLFHITKKWSSDTEVSYQNPQGKNHFTAPGLITLGGRYQPGKTISYHMGIGAGPQGTNGGNSALLYAGLKFPLTSPPPPKPIPSPTPTPKPIKLEEPKELLSTQELIEKVVYKKENIQVFDEVEFDLNESVLTERGSQIVQQVAKVILAHQSEIKHVHVDGHTDHQGTDEINDPLSQARAEAVTKELIEQGVSASLLTATGYGSRKPLFDYKNTPENIWEKNRRVEFRITPVEKN